MKNRIRIQCFIGYYNLVLGSSIFLLWILILAGDPLEEGQIELTFHLVSEWIMAGLCIGSGFCLVRRYKLGNRVNLAAHSMLIYSLLNAAGYYAERGEGSLAILFIVLLIPSILILVFASDC